MARRGAIHALAMVVSLAASFGVGASDHTNVRLREYGERRRVEVVLEGARRRIATPGCADVLATYRAVDGRTLAEVLAASSQTADRYLDSVLFYSGRGDGRCARKSVLAHTAPGSRAVLVCSQFYFASRHDPAYGEAILIHEAFHTLGLGENPPSSRDITARVLLHCR